jgi:hypothetical protein
MAKITILRRVVSDMILAKWYEVKFGKLVIMCCEPPGLNYIPRLR